MLRRLREFRDSLSVRDRAKVSILVSVVLIILMLLCVGVINHFVSRSCEEAGGHMELSPNYKGSVCVR